MPSYRKKAKRDSESAVKDDLPTKTAGSFRLASPFKPAGDQPKAIKELIEGIQRGESAQVLLGITGSGKTFTVANVIAEINKPTLIIAHNKILAAQLYGETSLNGEPLFAGSGSAGAFPSEPRFTFLR